MGIFDFWQRWGLELNDQQFAGAFTALGVLAATGNDSQRERADDNSKFSDDFQREMYKTELRMAVGKPFVLSRENRYIGPWSFPLDRLRVKIGTRQISLSSIDPLEIARQWDSLSGIDLFPKSRLRVISYPMTEPIRPWFRLLIDAVLLPESFNS